MANVPSESEILSAARPLVGAGIALHWLRRREKAPIEADWPTAPVHTAESLAAAYRGGSNIGVRPGEPSRTPWGYLHLLDMDVRDPAQAEDAWTWLLERWPDAREAPFVRSGSGGASEHRYFITDRPFRSRKLAQSDGFSMVFDAKRGREVKKRDWEIELYGTGKQAVLPPSIHPDTGEAYTWGREIDFGLLDLGVGPIVASDVVESWGAAADDLALDEDDDLFALMRAEPMGLSEAEITKIIGEIPNDDADYDDFLEVGMALAHEYQGSQVGFERWCEWGRQSAKFDLRTCVSKWKSFKGRKNPVRMASLIKKAGDYRLAQAHADLDDLLPEPDDDLADLLGDRDPSTALTVIPAPGDTIADDLADLLGSVAAPSPTAPGASLVYDPEWRSNLQRNEEGVIKPTLPNVQLIVRNDPRCRGIIAYNEFTQEIVLTRSPGRRKLAKPGPKPIRQLEGAIWVVRDPLNGDLWTDSHDAGLRMVIEAGERQGGYGMKVSQRDLGDAINVVAHENRFHPVRGYLEGLAWDGAERVNRIFIDYLGAEDNAYHRAIGRMTLIGAVTRIFEPGHKFDFVPILEGIQGKRKSTFIEILARSWFAELEGDLHDRKQLVEKMQGAWILEIPELQGFSKAEVTTIKGFVSARKDKVRMAYAKRAVEFLRQCIFMGSTNDVEYLRDATGGRRFWPVACNVAEIDTARLSREVDQIWAEAVVIYRAMRAEQVGGTLPLYLSEGVASNEAKRLQESRRSDTVEEATAGQIEAWLEKPIGSELGLDDLDGEEVRYRNEVGVKDVWVDMMGRDVAMLDQRQLQLIARALRMVPGWYFADRKPTDRWGRQRVFRREGVHFDY